MAYAFQTFSLNQVLTSSQMNQVEVNIRDHVHGAGGVVAIAEGDLIAVVDQAALKNTTATGSTTVAQGANSLIALTGGTYSWWTVIAFDVSGDVGVDQMIFGAGAAATSASGNIGFYNAGIVGDATVKRSERYIQASPPYSFGPLFVFAMVDGLGKIVNLEVGTDPTWAYHGPTKIIPQRKDEFGKQYCKVQTYDGKTFSEMKKDPVLLRAVLSSEILPVVTEIELTMEYKDSDMDVAPHPWIYNEAPFFAGKTIVLLEPGTTIMEKLNGILEDSHSEEVLKLISEGYVSIGNEFLDVAKRPSGVQIVQASWKNSN